MEDQEQLSPEVEQQIQEILQSFSLALDVVWELFSCLFMFFALIGLSLYESGWVRAKNSSAVFSKNMIIFAITGVLFVALGFGWAFGNSGIGGGMERFIGGGEYFLLSSENFGYFIFHWIWLSSCVVLATSSMSERFRVGGVVLVAGVIATLGYPLLAHTLFSDKGVLSPFSSNKLFGIGVLDYTGATVLHMQAGVWALVGCIAIGSRLGRFQGGKRIPIPGHDMPISSLGLLLAWIGFISFSGQSSIFRFYADMSSTASIDEANASWTQSSGRSMANLIVSVGGSVLSCFVIGKRMFKKVSRGMLFRSVLCGIAAASATGGFVDGYVALVCGIIAYPFHELIRSLVNRWWEIDDVLDVGVVHIAGSILSLVFVGLFAKQEHVKDVLRLDSPPKYYGIVYGGDAEQLLMQCIGIVVTFVWSLILSVILFSLINRRNWMRVSQAQELVGMNEKED
eukprot:TRINITY_DN10273_c0_g1_i1.p1 TRINITY_DN10273_c0_g1~~TRINITY_DN10273_c0_g1_i1.p1  ORF type:complete len:498 (-),score=96.35 TRINITY_DN10273_c0_g1_i1:108-1469(-)